MNVNIRLIHFYFVLWTFRHQIHIPKIHIHTEMHDESQTTHSIHRQFQSFYSTNTKLKLNIYIFIIVFQCRSTRSATSICFFFFFISLHAIWNEAMKSAKNTTHKHTHKMNQPQISLEQYHTVANMQTLITFWGLFLSYKCFIKSVSVRNRKSNERICTNTNSHTIRFMRYILEGVICGLWTAKNKPNPLYSCTAFDVCNIVQVIQFR